MTKIYIKGILAKKFGNYFSAFAKDAYSALKLIDANKEGFLKYLIDLNKKNIFYAVICDGKIIENEKDFLQKRKINNINIIPLIIGSGPFAGAIVGSLATAIIGSVISLALSFLMNSSNNQPKISIAVGGATAYVESKGRSYIFSNKENTVSQGSSIPIGYGIIKISSYLIHASINNYSTNQAAQSEFKLSSSQSSLLNYIN
jgi:predicted phage tail protein